MTGIKMTHVPYRGTAPALNDLIGGYIQVMFSDLGPALPLINAGKLRALAVTTKQRFTAAPNIPPLAEVGVPGYDAAAWQGVVAPAQTPKDIITKLNSELNAIVTAEDVRARLSDSGMNPVGKGSPGGTQWLLPVGNRALGQGRRGGRYRRIRVTGARSESRIDYCIRKPVALMTGVQRAISSCTNCSACCGPDSSSGSNSIDHRLGEAFVTHRGARRIGNLIDQRFLQTGRTEHAVEVCRHHAGQPGFDRRRDIGRRLDALGPVIARMRIFPAR